jgi:hypothetical protein
MFESLFKISFQLVKQEEFEHVLVRTLFRCASVERECETGWAHGHTLCVRVVQGYGPPVNDCRATVATYCWSTYYSAIRAYKYLVKTCCSWMDEISFPTFVILIQRNTLPLHLKFSISDRTGLFHILTRVAA